MVFSVLHLDGEDAFGIPLSALLADCLSRGHYTLYSLVVAKVACGARAPCSRARLEKAKGFSARVRGTLSLLPPPISVAAAVVDLLAGLNTVPCFTQLR